MLWTVKNMERDAETGGVTHVHWAASVETVDGKASSGGVVRLNPDPSSEGFVPYEELTLDTVLQWVFSNIHKVSIEDGLQAEAKAVWKPGVANGVPWLEEE